MFVLGDLKKKKGEFLFVCFGFSILFVWLVSKTQSHYIGVSGFELFM